MGEGGERRYLFVFGLDPFWVILGSEEINDINRKYYIYFLKCFFFGFCPACSNALDCVFLNEMFVYLFIVTRL